MNKYKVISDNNAMIKPRWIKLISPASKRMEVRNINKDAQEIYRISNFLVSIKKNIWDLYAAPSGWTEDYSLS